MTRLTLVLALTALALSASATQMDADATIHSDLIQENTLNNPRLAAHDIDINLLADVTDRPIHVYLTHRPDQGLKADLLKENKLAEVQLKRRLDLKADLLKEHRPIDIQLNRRLDLDLNLLKDRKPISVKLDRRLDLNADLLEGRKLINVKLDRRLDLNADLLEDRKLINVKLDRRLDLNIDLLKERRPIEVQLNRRLDLDLDLSKERRLIDVSLSNGHRPITIDLRRRHHDVFPKDLNQATELVDMAEAGKVVENVIAPRHDDDDEDEDSDDGEILSESSGSTDASKGSPKDGNKKEDNKGASTSNNNNNSSNSSTSGSSDSSQDHHSGSQKHSGAPLATGSIGLSLAVGALVGSLAQNVVMELSWQEGSTKKTSYVGWSGSAASTGSSSTTPQPHRPPGLAGDTIEMDPQFGQAMGLKAGQKVDIDFARSVQDGISINVAPYSEDDWEILELHAGYVEDQMLNQIRILYPNQIFTMWVNGRTLVRLRVLDINPTAPCVKLGANAEVIVAPMVRKANGGHTKPTDNQDLSAHAQRITQAQCLRVLALDEISEDLRASIPESGPFAVLVHPDSWIEADLTSQDVLKITKVVAPHAEKAADDETRDPEDLVVGLSPIFVRAVPSSRVPLGHVAISKMVQDSLDIENFSIVRVSETHTRASPLPSLTLRPISTPGSTSTPAPLKLQPKSASHDNDKAAKSMNLVSIFKEWTDSLPDDDTVFLSHGSFLSIPYRDTTQTFAVVFPPTSLPPAANGTQPEDSKARSEPEAFSMHSKAQLKQLKIEIGQPQGVCYAFKKPVTHIGDTPAALGGVSQVLTKADKFLLTCLSKLELRDAFSVPNLGGFLLCGPHGSGKTVVTRSIIRQLAQRSDTLAYCVEINCAEFAEDRIPVLMSKFQQWFDTAAFHSPSILFLEDLDRLIPAEVEHADSFRSRQIAEVFLQIATQMCKRFDRIAIVATAQQQVSVHPSLITSHLFSEIIRLTPPGKVERKEMLQCLMETGPAILQRSLPAIDLVSVASKTEGYLAADLKAFLERTVHEGAVRNIAAQADQLSRQADSTLPASPKAITNGISSEQGVPNGISSGGNDSDDPSLDSSEDFMLTQADFLKAQEGFVPSSLRGVKLQSSATSWLDIGGLTETRRILLETLEWPTKYASIFSQCPLRLRSGLLLFGHPGCGKTLLASAVAKECGLNFISVKGPELLNKYIGASEKSVRDLFERAQAAKPCVLFFDEFDSIAPKRGHDSTGVTDRVVNQMLTQMDGAEGLDGVYVLAATSRPDLIDPALLRPGRLDKSLLCGMPSLQDRYDILSCLARKMELAEGVDLMECARRTEGLTGADLQAVLYNAHLEAIRVAIEKDEAIKKERQNNEAGGLSSPGVGAAGSSSTSAGAGRGDAKMVRFVSLGGKGVGAGKANQKANLTLAERGQISQRAQDKGSRPVITTAYLEVSMKNTRSSITPEESLRLDLIYKEFMGDRTGEMKNGTGSHELGQRATLA
ncbi:Peroxisome biosynthesis protein pex1 [Lunasporangiospora selenospora]|uniref:Peroxisomal ATPase PEX1 n=1 Tax=Lunasporangiospora selenospora TaxID=979761 RepID=A0A9P6KIF5_9FUNG|nr:Peroxisome biosynthesis protein pex1 [Lunasporangiospora selenospora]